MIDPQELAKAGPPPAVRTALCGALGAYDPEVVAKVSQAVGPGLEVVHKDRRSILALDRPAIAWSAPRRRGLAWAEHPCPVNATALRSWQDAATAGTCGLVVSGRDRFVHSSDANIASIYYRVHDGAVYFASSVDALATSAPGTLAVDWDAWAAIIALGYPLGDRTPFEEIRRLGPATLLRIRRGGAHVSQHSWSWAEFEPGLDVAAGTPHIVDAVRDALARVPTPVLCTLSGGWDSRICLAMLAQQGRPGLAALTVNADAGSDREDRVAREVAAAIGVPHKLVAGTPEDWWPEFELHAERVDYQYVRPPWRMPLLAPMRRSGATVVDGFGFDTFAAAGDRFYPPGTDDPRGGDAVVTPLWKALKQRQLEVSRGPVGLRADAASAIWASARRQFFQASEALRGNPQRALLTFHLTRGSRGVAQAPYAVFGAEVPMALPFLQHEVVRAALSISLRAKRGGPLYRAVFDTIDPRLRTLPNVGRGGNPPGERMARRSESQAVRTALAECLAEGPLTVLLRPGVMRNLTGIGGKRLKRTVTAALAPAYFHLWHERYRDRLRDCDPADGWGY